MPKREHPGSSQPESSRQRAEPAGRSRPSGLAAEPGQPGPALTIIGADVLAKAAPHLGDSRLAATFRQSLAMHLGRVQGNRCLQKALVPTAHVAAVQRVVESDVTQTTITPDWAARLSDAELEEQVNIVRQQLQREWLSAEEQEAARHNLDVLEDTARRRFDPRRQLACRLVAGAATGGVTVAAYVTQIPGVRGAGEFQRHAAQYAKDHRAVGLDGNTVAEGVAMELTSSLPSLLASLSTAIGALLADFPDVTGHEPVRVPVKTLAIFTHGSRRGLQAGPRAEWIRSQLRPWVEGIAPYLGPSPLVLLFACLTAGQPPTGLPFAEELRLALAAELEELYGPAAEVEPVVWGHTTRGHTTANRFLVEFRGGSYSASTDLLAELGRRLAALAIERARSADPTLVVTEAQRATAERRGREAMQRVLLADTGAQNPTQVYVREIGYMGTDRVWRDLSSEATPDLSDLGLEPDATVRLTEGLRAFQRRFATERDRLQEWVSAL